ncbi:MAG: hypothetical protein L0215_19610 [Gemmataceae bacterium]|nr:hypothetical protein [Gemmataceae bacterium]
MVQKHRSSTLTFVPRLEELESRLTPGRIVAMPAPAATGPGLQNGGLYFIVGGDTPTPNNDNVFNKVNFHSQDVSFGATGFIDIEFTIDNTLGISEYWFEARVTNRTGVSWNGFIAEVGFGTGSSFAPAAPLAGEGLDFDWPDRDPAPFNGINPNNPPAEFFPDVLHDHSLIVWSRGATGNLLPNGQMGTFFFHIDVPDFTLSQMNPSVQTPTGYRMTLRLRPSVAPAQEQEGIQGSALGSLTSLIAEFVNASGQRVATSSTNSAGDRQFATVAQDRYYLDFERPTGYQSVLQNQVIEDSDSDINIDALTTLFLILGDENLFPERDFELI